MAHAYKWIAENSFAFLVLHKTLILRFPITNGLHAKYLLGDQGRGLFHLFGLDQ